jgi:DNA-binding transcriptional LysR family regulator
MLIEKPWTKSYVLIYWINMIYRLELYQIRHFAAVADTGSFTKAAIRAAVTQRALSASIAKVEEELGVVHRSSKSVTPTAAGRRFRSTAQEVLGGCNKVKAELRATESTDRSELAYCAHCHPRISRGSRRTAGNANRACRWIARTVA